MSIGSTTNITQAALRDVPGPLLELTDVRTHFRTPRGLVRAVDGVSFTLERGRSLGIVGESGSGKTILSRSIMGLLPTKGTERSGSIRFAGTEVGNKSRKEMRHNFGIGLTAKCYPACSQFISQNGKVFNYSIVNNGDGLVFAQVRMRINVIRCTMSCPTRMTDTR